MAKRRRIFYLASGFTTGMGLAAACGFPDPQLVPDEAGVAEAGGSDGTTDPDSSSVVDGGDGGARFDVVEPDAPPPIGDATTEKPPVDANCNPCDCDNDGFLTRDAAVCPDAGGSPRLDCDDLDPRAHPDAGFVKDQPTVDTQGDWNCDGVVRREIPAVNVVCANHGGLTGTCSSVQGFTADPSCGEKKSYVFCKSSGFDCVNGTLEERIQGCQ